LRSDCDNADENNWESCDNCTDSDLDSWYVGCDAYTSINGPDCDDNDANVYPGAKEICGDGIDQDCDSSDLGWVESETQITTYTADEGHPAIYGDKIA